MFLIDKKISVDKPLTLWSIAKYGYYNSRQLGLLQITTTLITIYDSLVITILDNVYYNLR